MAEVKKQKLTVEQFIDWIGQGDGYVVDNSPMLSSCYINNGDIDGDDSMIVEFSWVDDEFNNYEVFLSKKNIESGDYYPETGEFVVEDLSGYEASIYVYNFEKVKANIGE